MKKIGLLALVLLQSVLLMATDVIVTKDERTIEVKILEVSKTEIHYKEANYLDGPTFVISTDEISSITYGNGTVTVFKEEPKATPQPKPKKKSIYQNYTELSGFMSGRTPDDKRRVMGGIEGTNVYGCRFNEYAFLGAGIGVSANFYQVNSQSSNSADQENGRYSGSVQVPLFADLRIYIPTKKTALYPFFAASLGPQLRCYDFERGQRKSKFGVQAYFRAYMGVEYKRCNFGVGYMLWGDEKAQTHFGFVKLGVRLSRQSIY